MLLKAGSAPQLQEVWLRPGGTFDQRLRGLEDIVGRSLGGAEVVDCAGQMCGDTLVEYLLAWLRRNRLTVQALDLSDCDLQKLACCCFMSR